MAEAAETGGRERVEGVDLARGLALLGMVAVHVYTVFGVDGAPTVATMVAAGRSAATFALVAGVSLAFLSGGRRPLEGRERAAARAGIAVRAVLIAALGFALGYVHYDAEVILPFYAVLFLLAIPLLGLRPRVLAAVAAASALVTPLLVFATFDADVPAPEENPTFGSVFEDPGGLLVGLLLTGFYPALAYLAYVSAGLAIGRADLSSLRFARRLLAAGVALAVTAWVLSALLLFELGGLRSLYVAGSHHGGLAEAAQRLLWEPNQNLSWWWLALPAPHSSTPIDMVHTAGSAMAILGAALLLTRGPVAARLLRPVTAAGTMPLTLYTGHLLVLSTGVLAGHPLMQYLMLVVAALLFAVLWKRWVGQGPLERLVAAAAGAARRAVLRGQDVTARSGRSC